jgi:hypothetical protein
MAPALVPIVEGHGDVQAVPLLLRRLLEQAQVSQIQVARPIRIPKTKLLKKGELERAVGLAKTINPNCAGILVILDADDDRDCPKHLAPRLLKWAQRAAAGTPASVVLAKREFEAWFLGSMESLRGERGISKDASPPPAPEEIRDAKGWLSKHMPAGNIYKETVDQAALASLMDLEQARKSCPSFDKLCREITSLVSQISPSLFER